MTHAQGLAFGAEWGGFGAYIHWPYCRRICAYCDFNVYKSRDEDTISLVQAICADIARHRAHLPEHPPLDSVYFGGGTPSLLPLDGIVKILEALDASFGMTEACEITLEANPTDISAAVCAGWYKAGINRLSLGVQSLRDDSLKWLTRDHNTDQSKAAVENVGKHFDNFSVDAIYALPHQTLESWRAELEDFLALDAPHYALYELTVKAGTAFEAQVSRGAWVPVDDDAGADLYMLTDAAMAAAGYEGYEISNYARGSVSQSVHNKIYWQSGDWMGLGPGAHGRLSRGLTRPLTYTGTETEVGTVTRLTTLAAAKPPDYLAEVTQALTPTSLTNPEAGYEMLAMGLRMSNGIDNARFGALSGALETQKQLLNAQNTEDTPFFSENSGKLSVNAPYKLLTDLLTIKLGSEIFQ